MDEREVIQTLEDAMIYAHTTCAKNDCSQCPAFEYTKTPGNTCNCELYFIQEYFNKHNLHIMKEEC